jgi:hypothetical protein
MDRIQVKGISVIFFILKHCCGAAEELNHFPCWSRSLIYMYKFVDFAHHPCTDISQVKRVRAGAALFYLLGAGSGALS